MRLFAVALLPILVAAKLQILPNDADEQPCQQAACDDNEMCVIDSNTNQATCVEQTQLQEFVKSHGLEHQIKSNHAKNHCTINELHQMGGRLLKWFSDVHSHESGSDRSLPIHSIACRPEVGWMFTQWDGNRDGKLSKSELKPIERGGHEKCVEQFIDMCDDIQVDGSISVDEWCDCFTFSDNLRHEPPCHKEKHSVDPHMKDVFMPRCDLEGFYKPEQCHDGSCWCVDKYGREFDQSRVAHQLPDCGQYASDMTEDEISFLKERF